VLLCHIFGGKKDFGPGERPLGGTSVSTGLFKRKRNGQLFELRGARILLIHMTRTGRGVRGILGG